MANISENNGYQNNNGPDEGNNQDLGLTQFSISLHGVEQMRDNFADAGFSAPEFSNAAGSGAQPGGREPSNIQRSAPRVKTPAIDAFGRDLTLLAQQKKLDPVIGRTDEVERTIEILGRRTKNNPVLIGEAGVGKTAIVEGLAQRIIAGDVPEFLINARIVSLDLPMLVAGTKYRGQFEERMKAVMKEMASDPNLILFLDELHTIIGAGGSEGAIDAANMLKPALSRGEFRMIGATTLDEFRKHIEKDAALERRVQQVIVEPTTDEDTVAILKGIRERYEAHHKVDITDEAIEAAVKLSNRYITSRHLPDKAIDLIDEGSSRMKVKSQKGDPKLGETLQEKEADYERVRKEIEYNVAEMNFQKINDLRPQKEALKKEIAEIKARIEKTKGARPVVTEEVIAEVVARQTGIPLQSMQEGEREKLLQLEDRLNERVINQSQAVSVVAQAIRNARQGTADPNRPTGSFIFAGPTGVGKTHLCKAIAEVLFDDADALIQIDMSEYMEKHNVSKLIGAPPGYVGFEEAGRLEVLRKRPYAVLLLDEIEKAHPDVHNILLQGLEEGHITDSHGHKINLRNVIVVMTTNAGITNSKEGSIHFVPSKNASAENEMVKKRINDRLAKSFRPEFLNRIDELVVFNQHEGPDLLRIASLEFKKMKGRLSAQNVNLELDETAKMYLTQHNYKPEFGARPIRGNVKKLIGDALANKLLRGDVKPGDSVRISHKEGETEMSFEVISAKPKQNELAVTTP